jgi:integrase
MAKVAFTAGRVAGFKCPHTKAQAFLWDATAPGLGLRTTPAGKPAYVFQSRFQDKTIRITIGSPDAWGIPKAQEKARELQRQIDEGRDPRIVKSEKTAADVATREGDKRNSLTVGQVWPRYLAEGKPKRRDAWKPGYRAGLELMAAEGGVAKKRGKGKTRPGPLYPLMSVRLVDTGEDTLKAWYDVEAKSGKHQAARALMMFRGFVRWCSAQTEFRAMVDRDAGRAAAILEALPQVKKRTDCLEAAQLPGWFAGTDKLGNRTIATYLKALLLTGARREEVAALRWVDLDFRWRRMTLADKVDATRTIPMTPYLAQQFCALPRMTMKNGEPNPYVFASRAQGGRITEPRTSHAKVLADAGIQGLTIHGLRRSFSLLGEAAGAPAGAIAQVMGHKPSATAEGYRPRSVDALRPFLAQVEAHILKQAGIVFDADAAPPAVFLAVSNE